MITLEMVRDVILTLQSAREAAGVRGRRYYRVAVEEFDGSDLNLATEFQFEQQRLSKVTMAWHDVIRGCRTDEEFGHVLEMLGGQLQTRHIR